MRCVSRGNREANCSDFERHPNSRAMAPASKEAPFVFEFIFNSESGKYDELKEHPKVNVAFYDTK